MKCIYCELPIGDTDTHVGAGDGSGTGADGKFAHPGCYVKKRIELAEVAVHLGRAGVIPTDTAFDEIGRHLDDASHVAAVL